MSVFLTILFSIGILSVLSGAYFIYVVKDSIKMNEETGEKYDKEETEGFLNVSHISYFLFCIGELSGYGLLLGGIGMLVYRIII